MALSLVTGDRGWLGTNLLRFLREGYPDHPALAGMRGDPLRCFQGDIRNPKDCAAFCEGAEGATLFHLAGLIHPRRISELYDVNVTGTLNVLEAASRHRVRRVIVVSSNSPLGCNPHSDHVFDESSPYHPYMHYGRSKMAMELGVRAFASSHPVECVILRVPWFYGPHQPARQTLFFKMVRTGKFPLLGSGEQRRSMGYVDNLCQGILLAATVKAAAGRTYWIADARPYPMREIVDTVARLLRAEFGMETVAAPLTLPAILGDIAYLCDYGIQTMGLYHQKVHVLSEMNKTIACSIARAEDELGYRPTIALEEGMRRSIRWCLEKGLTL